MFTYTKFSFMDGLTSECWLIHIALLASRAKATHTHTHFFIWIFHQKVSLPDFISPKCSYIIPLPSGGTSLQSTQPTWAEGQDWMEITECGSRAVPQSRTSLHIILWGKCREKIWLYRESPWGAGGHHKQPDSSGGGTEPWCTLGHQLMDLKAKPRILRKWKGKFM